MVVVKTLITISGFDITLWLQHHHSCVLIGHASTDVQLADTVHGVVAVVLYFK